jgi:hypothetical protein
MIGLGVLVGAGSAFTGLGDGFLMVPLLLMMGYAAHKAVGTAFLAILVLSISALIAHNKLANVDCCLFMKPVDIFREVNHGKNQTWTSNPAFSDAGRAGRCTRE